MNVNKVSLHKSLCMQMNDLYKAKNADYGDSFAQLRSRYPNFVGMRVFDKLNRLENCMAKGSLEVKDETIEDTLMDIANYCIMELVERKIEGGFECEPTE